MMSLAFRILLPIAVLAIGLIAATEIVGADVVTDRSTLWWRILGWRILAGAVVSTIVVVLVLALARHVDRRSLRDYGLTSARQSVCAFGLGAIAWIGPAGIGFLTLSLFDAQLTLAVSAQELLLTVALVLAAVLLSEALPEELVFRGYVTTVLGERFELWTAILVQSSLFVGMALMLRGYTGVLDLSLFATMGICLGYMRMITGSVWTAIGFHTAFQTGSQLLLTHSAAQFDGPAFFAVMALGPLPFALGTAAFSLLPSRVRINER